MTEFRPGDRDHLCGGVQLHGARAERNHRLIQGNVPAFQAAQVAQHLGFTVVAVEHRVGQHRVLTLQRLRNGRRAVVAGQFVVQFGQVQGVVAGAEDVQQQVHVI